MAGQRKMQVPPLRYAPVGMTAVVGVGNCASEVQCRLLHRASQKRDASVGMTAGGSSGRGSRVHYGKTLQVPRLHATRFARNDGKLGMMVAFEEDDAGREDILCLHCVQPEPDALPWRDQRLAQARLAAQEQHFS